MSRSDRDLKKLFESVKDGTVARTVGGAIGVLLRDG